MIQRDHMIHYIDKPTIILYIMLMLFGWINIYSASYNFEQSNILNPAYRSGLQAIWIGVSVVVAVLVMVIDRRFYYNFAYLLYAACMLLLIVTIFVAPNIKGSHSWIVIGPVSLQPAEFAKFATALALAKLVSSANFNLQTARDIARAVCVVLLPMIIIILQQEMGSALVYLSFFLVLYRRGLTGFVPLFAILAVVLFIIVIRLGEVPTFGVEEASLGLFIAMNIVFVVELLMLRFFQRERKVALYMIAIFAGVVAVALLVNYLIYPLSLTLVVTIFVVASAVLMLVLALIKRRKTYFWIALFVVGSIGYCASIDYLFEDVLQPYQQMRIKVVLGMEDDPRGVGYNVNQSRIAIGSGGFFGNGFLQGTQTKLKYVPEQDTDFIFCTVGEEYGFLGSVALIALYMALLWRLTVLAERQNELFAHVYGYGVVGIILFHLVINIGMVLGLTPVIGIPLPFMSYGGSSLLSFTILLFIFLRLDAAYVGRR